MASAPRTVHLPAEPGLLKGVTFATDRAADRGATSEIYGGDHEGTQADTNKLDEVE